MIKSQEYFENENTKRDGFERINDEANGVKWNLDLKISFHFGYINYQILN